MSVRGDLPSLLAYSRWADARLLERAGTLPPNRLTVEPAPVWTSLRATLLHAAGATEIWVARLAGTDVRERPTEE